jgi:segregation and condensation protein B
MNENGAPPNGVADEGLSGDQLRLPRELMPTSLPDHELGALVEALLLVSPEPPTIEELSAGAEVPREEIERAIAWLEHQDDRGWIIQRHGRRIHLATAPRFAEKIRLFLGLDREAKLSSASLEVLALVAYQQPVTRAEIESVRGVDSSGLLAKLHARGLVEPVGRLQTVGNPIQYGTTAEFLNHFGLRSLDDLPPLGEIGGKDGKSLLEAATLTEPTQGGNAPEGDNGGQTNDPEQDAGSSPA